MAFGIICEYNPLHNGHVHQIKEIRKASDEPIICVMSGNFTQRGEIAIVDKYARAEAAICAGADLVLELPVPFSVSSAEYFASAALHIFYGVGVDKLSFGSESADVEKIINTARVACSPEFKAECKELAKNEGNASAYFNLLAKKAGVDELLSNDILGVEYAKAIIKNDYKIEICPIKREGNAYREKSLTLDRLPSATAIRESIYSGNLAEIEQFVPEAMLEHLRAGKIASIKHAQNGILLALRLMDKDNFDCAISDRGLVNRILKTAHECSDFDDFYSRLQTKKYTEASIRRAILYILLGIKRKDLLTLPSSTVLLAANEKGRKYLSALRKSENNFNVITKPSKSNDNRAFEINLKADALYTMCFENKKESGFYIKKKAVIK